MSVWKANGPILIRVTAEDELGEMRPVWVNPALIETVREANFAWSSGDGTVTVVNFSSGLSETFRMPMNDFFARLAEATQAKYGD